MILAPGVHELSGLEVAVSTIANSIPLYEGDCAQYLGPQLTLNLETCILYCVGSGVKKRCSI